MIEPVSEIIDSFGRKHTYLRISVTDLCNLRCFYCMPEEGIDLTEKHHLMSLEEMVAIARQFTDLGIDTIRLTGGEPLVRKNFSFLVQELSQLPVRLKLTTNGILLHKYLDQFESIGLNDINISLDSLDKVKNAFITKRDYFDRIHSNIKEALRRGFHVKLNVVLIKGLNDGEILDFIELTSDQQIIVKFIEFMPFRGNKWDWSKGVSEQEILDLAQGNFSKVLKLEDPKHSTSSSFKIDGFKGTFGVISTITKPFCDGCNRIRLTADGKMKNCLFAANETDLLTDFRRGRSIKPLIFSAISKKKYSRDGMEDMKQEVYEQNRSMIAIGG
ncbi:MAG: GTP 3',8-cyclase MoaA [Bacteroidota bacterium]